MTARGAHNGKRATVEEHTDKRVRIKFDHDEGQACLAEESMIKTTEEGSDRRKKRRKDHGAGEVSSAVLDAIQPGWRDDDGHGRQKRSRTNT